MDKPAKSLPFPQIQTVSAHASLDLTRGLNRSLLHENVSQTISFGMLMRLALQKPPGKMAILIIFLSCLSLLFIPIAISKIGLISGATLFGWSFFTSYVTQRSINNRMQGASHHASFNSTQP
jgi:hypothetical protein